MVYSPHTPETRAQMLATLGLDSVEQLFDDIPAPVRATGLELPEPVSELTLSRELAALASRNRVDLTSFLGAGVYAHYIPAAVDAVLSRGEFYTAYTPYQPEISQGTLQTIYEFQSLIGQLTGLPVVSASHYDGATATAEAALMTVRATRRDRVLISRALQRHYVETAAHLLLGRQPRARGAAHHARWPHRPRGARGGPRRRRATRGRRDPGPAQRLRAAGADGRCRSAGPRGRGAVRGRGRAHLAGRAGATGGLRARTSLRGRGSRWASRPSTAGRTWVCSPAAASSSARSPGGWSARPPISRADGRS